MPPGNGHGDGEQRAVEDGAAEIGAEQGSGRGWRRMRRHHGVRDGESGGHRKAVEEQRLLRFLREIPGERHEDDEADFEEDRKADQEGGDQDGPDGVLLAELV